MHPNMLTSVVFPDCSPCLSPNLGSTGRTSKKENFLLHDTVRLKIYTGEEGF